MECARKSDAFARDLDAGDTLQVFYETPVIPAAAMVVRRNVLERIGPFDPIFGSYYEDYDLCHRIRSAGFKVGVCTTGVIAHFSGSATTTPAAEKRRARWVTRNRVIFAQRVARGSRLASLTKHFLTTFPRGLLRSMLKRPKAKPVLPYLQAHWDLVKLSHRLVSEPYDQWCWNNYLVEIGWPTAMAESSNRAGTN
jgi:GT2 family glycosyltransferase